MSITQLRTSGVADGAITLAKQSTAAVTRTITVTFGDGTNVPAANTKARIARMPSGGTITKWSIVGDVSGSCTIDVKTASAGSSPSFSSIVGGGTKPVVSSAVASVNNAPASWSSSSFAATDMMEFNLDSVTTMTRITLNLEYTAS